jgi:hypothetical protein
MANWVELMTKGERISDLERNERMNLDLEPDAAFGVLMVDLDKVSGFGPLLGEDAQPIPDYSELMMDSGFWMIVEKPYADLKQLFLKTKKKTNE